MNKHLSSIIILLSCLCSCKNSEKNTVESHAATVNSSEFQAAKTPYLDLDGNTVFLSDYKGKKILLNFWATWCRPCVEEMPYLERSKPFLEKENYVMLLATDQTIKEIKPFIAKTNYRLNFLSYTGTFSQLNIYALPTTFIYNEQGEKVDEIIGASDWDSPEMIHKLKNIK